MRLIKNTVNCLGQTLIEPSVKLASKGFEISERQARELNDLQQRFTRLNPLGTALVKEGQWVKGEKLVQQELANTLIHIRDKGKAGFYEGPVADSIVAEMKRSGGIITHQDLKNYQAVWRKPILGAVQRL